MLDYFFIRHVGQAREVEFSAGCSLSHVFQVRRLLFRQSYRSQLSVGQLEDALRRHRIACQRRKRLKIVTAAFPFSC